METVCEKWWMPPDINVDTSLRIWRYMDLAKYLSFLKTKSIRLSRADTFEDPYEGLINNPTVQVMQNVVPGKQQPFELARNFADQLEEDRKSTFVNCWHWSESESAAMWKLYSNNDYCVAIVSNIPRLLRQLPEYVAFSCVRYIDWEAECFLRPELSQAPYILL